MTHTSPSKGDTLRIEQLTIYPVKSLRGISVDRWPITDMGLAFDRQWMLVMPNGRFVTQRQLPQMALIETAIDHQTLTLSAANKGSVSLPLNSPTSSSNQPEIILAQVWRDDCQVVEACKEASDWLNTVLQPPQPLRLVTMLDGSLRTQSQPERFGPHTRTLFADAAPFLIANQASLDSLNSHLRRVNAPPVDMRRFRPNIVISGLEAFTEHDLNTLSLEGSNFTLVDHCERCVITTIDPDTAQKDPHMLIYKKLAEINPMPDKPKAPAFGVNAVLDSTVIPQEKRYLQRSV